MIPPQPRDGRKRPRGGPSYAPFRGWQTASCLLPTAVRRGLLSFALRARPRPTIKLMSKKESSVKTNAARMLDAAGIHYELREYTVDEDDLSAPSVAAKIGMP